MKNVYFLALILTISLFANAQTATPPAYGVGTEASPYQIASAENLYWISENSTEWDKHYIQTQHIDLTGYENLIQIGGIDLFSGCYDGQGFSISNFVLHRPDADGVALFGYAKGLNSTQPSILKNIVLENADIIGKYEVGGIAGYLSTAEIHNCKTSGSVTGERNVGGLVGYASVTSASVIITYCSSSCNVSGSEINKGEFVGGLIGKNLYNAESFEVRNCYATGDVSGYATVGGFIGKTDEGFISDCYSRGNVIRTLGPTDTFGSFVGSANESVIQNSYSTGQVIFTGDPNPADKGFAAVEVNAPVWTANFFDSEASLQTSGIGATPKTTAEMTTELTFTNAGWDFVDETINGTNDYWDISATENDGYPYLMPTSDPVSSRLPNALNFDGTNDYVVIPQDGSGGIFDNNSLNSSFTLEIWFRVPNYANFSALISKHSNSGGRKGFFMESNGGGSIRAGFANTSNAWTVLNASTAVNDNQWHHAAFTYDGQNHIADLYIDGVWQSGQTGFIPVFDDLVNLRLASSEYYGNYSEVEIDEFRVWDIVHTACDIKKYMKTEISLPQDNLIAYYRFNEGEPGGNNPGLTSLPNMVSETERTGTLNNFILYGETSNWISSGAELTGTDEYFDDEPPVITSAHPDISVGLDDNCEILLPDYTGDLTYTDNCDDNAVISQQPEAGTTISDTTLVTLTVTDYGNNTDEVSFYAEVSDSHAPVITTVFNDTIIEAESNCKIIVSDYTSEIEATDNCNIEDLTIEQNPLPGTEMSGADNVITLTVSDRFGNTDQANFLISVSDTTPPQITSNHNDTIVYIENCQAFLPDYTTLVEATDNCGTNFTITQNLAAGTEIFGSENTLNIQVTDDNNNTSEISFNVAVSDTIMPEITCPQNFSVEVTKDEFFYEIPDNSLNYLSASDNCNLTNIYNDFNMTDDLTGVQIPVGNNMISWFAEDEFGNTAVCRLTATVYNQWDYYKFEENDELNHPDGLAMNMADGKHTATTDNWAFVGLSVDDEQGQTAGAAQIYRKQNSDWIPYQRLTASDAQDYDNFGYALTGNDEFVFIASPFADEAGNNTGAVYVFQNTDNIWTQTEILTPENPQANSEFGCSVDVSGDKLIVGAQGKNKAYIFEYNSGQWLQTAVLTTEDYGIFARFGHATAVYENTAVVGAYIDNTYGSNAGSAFVFEKEGDAWQQKAKLISSNIGDYDEFGGSADIYGDEIIVAASKNSENGHYAGMAYIFDKPTSGWKDTTETAILQPSAPLADDVFGSDVSLYNGRAVVGAYLADPTGPSSGSIYVFDKPLTGWNSMTETQQINPQNSGLGCYLGKSVSISSNYIMASAPGTYSAQGTNGALFMFSMIKPEYPIPPQNIENICAGTDTAFHTTALHYDTIRWEISYDEGQTFSPIEEGGAFAGFETPALSFSASESLDSTYFRCKLQNYVHTVYSDTVIFSLDTEAPIIENLDTQILPTDETCTAIMPDFISQISISDNCDTNLSIEQNPQAGAVLNTGTYSVSISAADTRDNYSEMIFELIVEDQSAPEITSNHTDQQLDADANCEAALPDYTGTVTATDNCDATLDVTQSPTAGSTVSGTSNTVTLTVTDDAGNFAEVSFIVEVIDNTNPTISCPGNQTINLNQGETFYTIQGTEFDPLETSDNCGVADVINDFNASFTLENEELTAGTYTITWTVTDNAGNENSCSFDVVVNQYIGMGEPISNGMRIYPNPTSGKLFFEFAGNKVQSISIMDVVGNRLMFLKPKPLAHEKVVDFSAFDKGIYYIRVETDKASFLTRIIKN